MVRSEDEGAHTVMVDGFEAGFSVEIPASGFSKTIIMLVVAIVVFAAVGQCICRDSDKPLFIL